MLVDKQLEDAYDAWFEEKEKLVNIIESLADKGRDDGVVLGIEVNLLDHIVDFIERCRF